MSPLRRRVALGFALVAGAMAGVITTMTFTDPTPERPVSGAETLAVTPRSGPSGEPIDPTEPVDAAGVLLIWTSGGLPPRFADAVGSLPGVERLTMVRGDETALTASFTAEGRAVDEVEPGWHLPVDALAVDPPSYAGFVGVEDVETLLGLGPGEVLLTETSARLRRLDVGATVVVAGAQLTVAGVIDDLAGAGAELIVSMDDGDRIAVTTSRYVLVAHTGDRAELQRGVADLLDGRAVRFRSPAETTWMRHGDAVEPPMVMKARFGEFAIRDRSGRDVEIEPAWVARWIVTEPVPILGDVTCNREVIGPLRAAMADLEQASLAHLVDASAFAGCFGPRRIAIGQPLSHHAWGAAVDLNVGDNPRGSFSTQDSRLVETMGRHGFTWGGTWLVPDPAHYEAPSSLP